MPAVMDLVPRELTDVEFGQLQRLIHQRAGIYLNDGKRALLVGRLGRRVRELGLPTFGAYYRAVVEGDGAELQILLDAIATNETHFFREPRQFDLLAGRLCGEWMAEAAAGMRPRALRVWSAACSTGEEPYSIAMVLHDRLVRLGWDIAIEASDLSTKVLALAAAGVWRADRAAPIPQEYLKSYMLRGMGPEAGKVKAGELIRGMIRFRQVNLRESGREDAMRGKFDVIFCRNVLIYFDAPTRSEVLRRLARHLVPGGYLFLGHAESVTGTPLPLTSVMPAVYRLNAEPAA